MYTPVAQIFHALAKDHRLINYIDSKAKCRHLNILTCKATFWQAFIRFDGVEIQYSQSGWDFAIQLRELLPL
jgi:hypothetical protein